MARISEESLETNDSRVKQIKSYSRWFKPRNESFDQVKNGMGVLQLYLTSNFLQKKFQKGQILWKTSCLPRKRSQNICRASILLFDFNENITIQLVKDCFGWPLAVQIFISCKRFLQKMNRLKDISKGPFYHWCPKCTFCSFESHWASSRPFNCSFHWKIFG